MTLVLFDFDGTIADSKKVFLACWNELAAQKGYKEATEEDMKLAQTMTIKERCQHFKLPFHKIPLLIPTLYASFKTRSHEVPLFDGIKETIEQLQQAGCELAIVSSNDADNIRAILTQHHIPISTIYTSRKLFGKDKMIMKIKEKRPSHERELIYVGDEVRDIEACRHSKIPIIWVDWGYDAASLVEKYQPDFIAHKPSDIFSHIVKN